MPPVTTYPFGIHALDASYKSAGYPQPVYDAVHLIVDDGRAAFVDTGTHSCVPGLLAALDELQIPRDHVDYVLLTHVHLDHAGGAGLLMRELPAARLVVHPRGARHMIDPARLFAATCDVYGREATVAMYGELVPVAAHRVVEAVDDLQLALGRRTLRILNAPGHAKHHVVVHDSLSNQVFTGDTFGLSYRQLDVGDRSFIFPTTTPSQFDPVALHHSIDRIAALQPDAAFLTHYSRIRGVQQHALRLHRLIDAHVAVAVGVRDARTDRRARIRDGLDRVVERESAEQGWNLQGEAAVRFLDMDLDLNAQGLDVWLAAPPSR